MASFKYPCYKWSLLNGKVHEGKSRGPQCEEMLYEIHGFTQDSESWFPDFLVQCNWYLEWKRNIQIKIQKVQQDSVT